MRKAFCLLFVLLFPLLAFSFDESTAEFSRAEKEFDSHKYTQAETDYRLALVKYQGMGNLAAYIKSKIGECCQYQKKTEEAVALFREVQNKHANSPLVGQMQEKIARAYYENKQYDKAAPEFEKLAEQTVTTTVTSEKVNAAAVHTQEKITQDKKTESLGYAAYCYKKSGDSLKFTSVSMKIKSENRPEK